MHSTFHSVSTFMSFQGKKGGAGGNPFARGGTAPSGGGQQQFAPRGNPSVGGRSGGASNPFAKPTNAQPQATNYQANNQHANKQQWSNQGQNPQQQVGGRQTANFSPAAPVKANFNPFAAQSSSGAGFGGIVSGGMEMDSSSGVSGGQFQQQPRASFGQHNPPSNNRAPIMTSNPFAPSSQQAVNHNNNIFASSNNNSMGGQSFHHTGGSQFQQQQSVKQNPFFAGGASQPQQSPGMFNTAGNNFQPQQQNQFTASLENQGFQQGATRPSAPAAPVRAEVSAQAISAVNMSAALAPSQVEEIDLGLGLNSAPVGGGINAGTVFPPQPPASALKNASDAGSSVGTDDQEVLKMIALLDGILASSVITLQGLAEDAPGEVDVYQLLSGGALVAGRVPAVPPARSAQAHLAVGTGSTFGQQGTSGMKQSQSNPFSNAAGGANKPNSIFGIKQ